MHVDEGTIHAWLDGELSPEESGRIEAHIAACPACAAAVAEARGLVAASSRILSALDDVPAGVRPMVAGGGAPRERGMVPRRTWWRRPQFAAAAGLLVMAIGSYAVLRESSAENSARALEGAASAPTPGAVASTDVAAPAPAAARADEASSTASTSRETAKATAPASPVAGMAASQGAEQERVADSTAPARKAADVDEPRRRVMADAIVSGERERLAGEVRVQLNTAASAPTQAAPPPAAAGARSELAEARTPSTEAKRAAAGPAARCFDLQRSAAAIAAGVPPFVELSLMPGTTVAGRLWRPVVSVGGAGWMWHQGGDGGLFVARLVDNAIAYEARFTGIGTTDVVGSERPCLSR